MGNFELKKIISGHHDSINALSFSHDGSLFASGGDDGLINIFQGHGSGRQIHRFQVKAPVTTLLWHTRFGHTILVGDASGDVHTLCLEVQSSANANATVSVTVNKCIRETTEESRVQQRNSLYHVFNRVHGPVHCIAQSGVFLAIGSGKVVQLVKQGTIGSFKSHLRLLADLNDEQLLGKQSPCSRTRLSSRNWKENYRNLWRVHSIS